MSDTSYNGWSNWETWNMALWLDNDEGFYFLRRRLASRANANIQAFLADIGSPYVNGTPDMDRGDVSKVDWDEIADAWNDE
jgi:hypothetical protein